MEILFYGWLSKGFSLVLWAGVCWGIMAGLDALNEDPFSEDKTRIESGNMAVALYRSARWIGLLMGSGLLLS